MVSSKVFVLKSSKGGTELEGLLRRGVVKGERYRKISRHYLIF